MGVEFDLSGARDAKNCFTVAGMVAISCAFIGRVTTLRPEDFIRQTELLTGSDVKGRDQIDFEALALILGDDTKRIDCSQLNELLLLVHKHRVETPFFEHFFGKHCTIGKIPLAVERVQKAAMLLYGNFVFAYRKLSRIKNTESFQAKIADLARDPSKELHRFQNRQPKLLEVDRISRELTPFVGYLTAGEISGDYYRCELLLGAAKAVGFDADWSKYESQTHEMVKPDQVRTVLEIIQNYRKSAPDSTVGDFSHFLADSQVKLQDLRNQVRSVRERATRNQNTYLTWDHMDVYFATSMRKSWEYEDLYDFIEQLMANEGVQELGLRYFDPTQAYTENRVNKGLVEALMLKRAFCTVYSVQDTDTLGKDSELASTLAQGKPVIAYVPAVDVEQRAKQLVDEDPGVVLDRLRFVLYADEKFAQRLGTEEISLLGSVEDALNAFCADRIWLALPDLECATQFREEHASDLLSLCRMIAKSERAVYDKRAHTLSEIHPLSLQVNLSTGVANGVLVVRTIADCAALLRRILLWDMDFCVEEKDKMWYLRERVSGCAFRVVTNDRKLNNSFWNFYRQ